MSTVFRNPSPTAGTGYKKAGIIPVSRGTRTETIIIFVTDVWDDLVNLLHDPVAYLKSQQFVFDVLSDPYVEWEMLAPITLTLKCGGNHPFLAQKTASLLQDHQTIGQQLKGVDFSQDPAALACDLADKMSGVFHVEIATYTSFVEVVYYPPNVPVEPTDPVAYKNALSQPVYLSGQGVSAGTLHFDIDPSARSRGQLAASIAQDPKWLIGKLTGIPFDHQQGRLVTPNEPIPKAKYLGQFTFNEGELDTPDGTKYSAHVDITMTGLSSAVAGANYCMQMAATGTVPASAPVRAGPPAQAVAAVSDQQVAAGQLAAAAAPPITAVASPPAAIVVPSGPGAGPNPQATKLTIVQCTAVTYNHAEFAPSETLVNSLIDLGVPMPNAPADIRERVLDRAAGQAKDMPPPAAGGGAGSPIQASPVPHA